jgi:hypothetical protein
VPLLVVHVVGVGGLPMRRHAVADRYLNGQQSTVGESA